MEFQGGEPSLMPDLMKFGIERAEEINKTEKRNLTYVLCTNCRRLTAELLAICKQYHVLISTSLDGPAFIHNKDRGRDDSYEKTIAGITKAREVLGQDAVSVLMTTSELSLDYPNEIVDEYVNDGFHDIFLRALNPYGLAAQNNDWNKYNDRFIEFYKKAFEHILSINKQGTFFRENYASIILRKMLTPFTTGFVDLQSPAGTVNSAWSTTMTVMSMPLMSHACLQKYTTIHSVLAMSMINMRTLFMARKFVIWQRYGPTRHWQAVLTVR